SLKTSIKTITYLSDTGCLEIQGASLPRLNAFIEEKTKTSLLSKRKQIIYLLMQSMRIDGYMER
ncbi:hypothetical protein ACQ9AN_23200, partial [Escherichia coli]|uniref:hypothetical protein n=1 Tax=Escherichia coli TaxID=562 RepID=UPI003D36A65F